MTKPVLGFENLLSYVLVDTGDFEPFKWFQSVENPEVAFVLVNPHLFFPDYVIEINPREVDELEIDSVEDLITYVIVSIPHDYTRMTVNLQGPILINPKKRLAKQLVLVDSDYPIRQALFDPETMVEAAEKAQQRQPVGV
jgi:flagellar assembly factor FliW